MADASVRPAAAPEAASIAALQATVWSAVYAGVLPADALAAVGSAEAAARWLAAIEEPPTPRHRVLVALAGDELTGFAAVAPATDPDLVPALDAELVALCVAAERSGQGHGSRLVNAVGDVLRDDGFHHVHVWLAAPEASLRRFLVGAGWADDGARRSLDLHGDGEVLVEQERLRAGLTDSTGPAPA